jgi:hypothetical protein
MKYYVIEFKMLEETFRGKVLYTELAKQELESTNGFKIAQMIHSMKFVEVDEVEDKK